jgi:hypothetical protein
MVVDKTGLLTAEKPENCDTANAQFSLDGCYRGDVIWNSFFGFS